MEAQIQSRFNLKDRAQTAKLRSRVIRKEGLCPPLIVGHNEWYKKSQRNLADNKSFRFSTRQEVARGHLQGHLPVTRDMLITETNKNIHRYNQDVNVIIYELQRIYDELNIKKADRLHGKLQLAIRNIKTDIQANLKAQGLRNKRPADEAAYSDKVDDVVSEEYKALIKAKQDFEKFEFQVVELMREIEAKRKEGKNVLTERKSAVGLAPNAYPRDLRIMRTRSAQPRSRSLSRSLSANLASVPLPSSITEEIKPLAIDTTKVGPTEPVTSGVKNFADSARTLIQKTTKFCSKVEQSIEQTITLVQTLHLKVNDTFSRKVAETENLLNQFKLADAHQRHTMNSTLRYKDHVVKAKAIALGVENINDLKTFERLDRPLVSNYRFHYGNKTNELNILKQVDKELLQQRVAVDRRLRALSKGRSQIVKEIKDKSMASSLDAAALRVRRREAMCI